MGRYVKLKDEDIPYEIVFIGYSYYGNTIEIKKPNGPCRVYPYKDFKLLFKNQEAFWIDKKSYDNFGSLVAYDDKPFDQIEAMNNGIAAYNAETDNNATTIHEAICTCNSRDLFNFGCKCGAFQKSKV